MAPDPRPIRPTRRPRPRRRARSTQPRRRARSRPSRSPVAARYRPSSVPRWVQLVVAAALAAGAVGARPRRRLGPADPDRRERGRADPQPDRQALPARSLPRGLAIVARVPGRARDHRGIGVLSPTRSAPGHHFADERPAHRPPGQPRARQAPEVPQRTTGSTSTSSSRARPRCRRLQKEVLKRSGVDRLVLARPARPDRHDFGFDLVLVARPVRVPARLRPADRRPRAQDHAAGRRDARGRLPAAGPAGGLGLRAWPAHLQPDHGHERRARAVDLRRCSGSFPTARTTRSSSAPSTA